MQLTQSGSFWASSEYRAFGTIVISIESNLHISLSFVVLYERSGVWIVESTGCVFEKSWWVAGGAHTATAAATASTM